MPKRKAAAVSMEEDLNHQAVERARSLGFPTFSAYVVQLIRNDLMDRREMMLREHPINYATPKKPRKKS